MRLLGWLLLFVGPWSLWEALADGRPLAPGGVILVLMGLVLVSARGRAVTRWIGQGVLTGLCVLSGLLLLLMGVLGLILSGPPLAGGVTLAAWSLVAPLAFLASGLVLVGLGVRRLWRLRGLP